MRNGEVSPRQRALFLDRDGVINVDHGYVSCKEKFDFVDGVFDLACAAFLRGYRLVVVTNQAGIGRGYYSEEQFWKLTAWMCGEFSRRGAEIEKVYFSPFHPTEGVGLYKRDDVTRKPRPGMIWKAQAELNLDLEQSVLIGDKASDIQAGISAGVGVNILFSKTRPIELPEFSYVLISNLREALSWLDYGRAE